MPIYEIDSPIVKPRFSLWTYFNVLCCLSEYTFPPADALRHSSARHAVMPGGTPPWGTLCAWNTEKIKSEDNDKEITVLIVHKNHKIYKKDITFD